MKDFHVQWHITEICNFKCLHCYKEPKRKELNLEELKIVADRLNEFVGKKDYNLTISVTGGEPFLKPEVYDVVEYIENFSSISKINFITNGSIIPNIQRLKKISKLGILYVSLESINSKVNDKIRGKRSYEIVVNNLYTLCKNFDVGIMTTLMTSNIDDLISNLCVFVEKIFSIGAKEIIFERFIPVGEAKSLKNEVVSLQKILEFYSKIAKMFDFEIDELKKYPAIKIINKGGNFDLYNLEIYGAECVFNKDGFAILCDGSIYPCRRFSYEIGNFYTEKFSFDNETINTLNLLKEKFYSNEDIFCCYAMIKSLKT